MLAGSVVDVRAALAFFAGQFTTAANIAHRARLPTVRELAHRLTDRRALPPGHRLNHAVRRHPSPDIVNAELCAASRKALPPMRDHNTGPTDGNATNAQQLNPVKPVPAFYLQYPLGWSASLQSDARTGKVQVARIDHGAAIGGVLVRDLVNLGPVLAFSQAEWHAFLDGAANGQFRY
ncbi:MULTISPECIES: DUF397 domain-containing protein [unclassified Pseudofrankia]|uniref:DUF397 domain-containing protein n=1 Tax=unclassified Pseudofrankia TaxID=2994372 RepID=UPI0026B874E4|nr:DUF397 domain-containing protein [Pseudofrankia sp. BMG5.37]